MTFKEQADELIEKYNQQQTHYARQIFEDSIKTLIQSGEAFIKILDEHLDYFEYLRGKIGYLCISRNIELKAWDVTNETKEEIQESITKLKEAIK